MVSFASSLQALPFQWGFKIFKSLVFLIFPVDLEECSQHCHSLNTEMLWNHQIISSFASKFIFTQSLRTLARHKFFSRLQRIWNVAEFPMKFSFPSEPSRAWSFVLPILQHRGFPRSDQNYPSSCANDILGPLQLAFLYLFKLVPQASSKAFESPGQVQSQQWPQFS